MSSDASAAAASPMTNGTASSEGHREADASNLSTSLAEVCADLNRRVTNFLNAVPKSEAVKHTQEQTRIAVEVIHKALQDYEYVQLSSCSR